MLYQVYSGIRNLSEGSTRVAYRHARQLMEWQGAIGLNHEETLQSWALNSRPLIIFMNYVYGSLHFIVTAGAVIYLYRRFPGDYPRWRNTLALTTILALVGFIFWPLMPPRLLYTVAPGQYDFVDTLARYPTFWSFESGAINKISNQYAAMPSLHFGWSLFCAASLAPRVRRRGARMAAALYPLLTLAAIVLTANHFMLDAAGGAVVFLAGYWLARRFTRPGPVLTDPTGSEAVGPVPAVRPRGAFTGHGRRGAKPHASEEPGARETGGAPPTRAAEAANGGRAGAAKPPRNTAAEGEAYSASPSGSARFSET